MKLNSIVQETEFARLSELTGTMTQANIPNPTGTQPVTTAQTPQQPQTLQQVDPAQAAAALKQRNDQKKQIQDQIRQTEKQLQDLRKQLASLG